MSLCRYCSRVRAAAYSRSATILSGGGALTYFLHEPFSAVCAMAGVSMETEFMLKPGAKAAMAGLPGWPSKAAEAPVVGKVAPTEVKEPEAVAA